VTFQTLVKEVKAKKLPDADDEFAKSASEFDSIQELREDIRTKLRALKEAESRGVVRELVLRKLVDSVDVELPSAWSTRRPSTASTRRERIERQGEPSRRPWPSRAGTSCAFAQTPGPMPHAR